MARALWTIVGIILVLIVAIGSFFIFFNKPSIQEFEIGDCVDTSDALNSRKDIGEIEKVLSYQKNREGNNDWFYLIEEGTESLPNQFQAFENELKPC